MSFPEFLSVLMLFLSIAGIMIGVPVAFVLMGLGFIFGLIGIGASGIGYMYPINVFGLGSNYSFLAVPVFIFMGTLMVRSGITDRLYGSLHILMGGLRGGLALATVLVATLFGACTGVIGASIVGIGLLALPGMLDRGYSKPLVAGTICGGGVLGMIIPPSILLIIYGPMANLSIARLFFASAVPGILLSALYLIYIFVACQIKPEWGPVLPKEERSVPKGKLITMLLTSLVPPLFLILAVLGVIFFGIAAPTEAAGTGAIGALILLAAYGHFTWANVKGAFLDALPTVSMVMFVILGAKFFTITFLNLGGADVIRRFLLGFNLGPMGVLFLMLFLAFIMGMFMDFIGIMFIITPIYAPLITSFGFDPLWFGMLFCLTLVVSLSTPPFAYAIFYLKGIAPPEMDLLDMYKGIVPFVILQIITVVLVWFFPDIVLWLPGIMFTG